MSQVYRLLRLSEQMRFWRFNGVGIAGFVVQIAILALLIRAGEHYLAATVFAVEAAVLHHFLWHERWTWRDRPASGIARLDRLWRFHVCNGLVSLIGNLILMQTLVGLVGMQPVVANAIAVLACGLVNFTASDRLVFRET
jgi:dolichol-phosphate mannosyltransferase